MLHLHLTRRRAVAHLATSSTRLSGARHSSSIKSLHAAFRDPSSPFYLAPGTQGPEHEADHDAAALHALSQETRPAEEARAALQAQGYDPQSFWEQPVVWGDHDSFQHVNNVRYLRFFESGRIEWMRSLGHEAGGAARADAMVRGRGVSLILKSVALDYRRPVTYPDTLLIAHKPVRSPSLIASAPSPQSGSEKDEGKARRPRTHFHVKAVAWSYAQRRVVTECDSVLVWYDYDKLAKCSPGEEMLAILERRMKLCGEA